MTNDTILESSYSLLLESANFAKSSYEVKAFVKINVQKMIIYTFLTMPFQICKKISKVLNNLIFNQEKLKMCKFPSTGILQNVCNFFTKNSFPYVKGFPKS